MIREHIAAVLRPRDRSVMKAAVFTAAGRIVLDDKPVPAVGPGDALIRITTTTICGTDVHILKGEHVVAPGRIVLDDKQVPDEGNGHALFRITNTTICGTVDKNQ
jgi:threonine dehydrogenase-like Zn-dependent dehydrogenase